MFGIRAFSCYVPRYRLSRKIIFQSMGWFSPGTVSAALGERTVANYDEDSLTMAVAASMNCLDSVKRRELDAVYLASTTLPYLERENAAILNSALDLSPDIRSADFRDSLKCGTTALLSGLDALQAKTAQNILVAASDCRLARLGSIQEHYYGDGAAAFVLGADDVLAEFLGSFSVSADFPDYMRAEGKPFNRNWEDRWIINEGFMKLIPQAISGLLNKYHMDLEDFAKVIYPCYFKRTHMAIAKRLGIPDDRLQDNLHETIGDTGAAHPLLMLVGALEKAEPGDKILVASYGSGSDALFFEVTDQIKNVKKNGELSCFERRRKELTSYEKFTIFKRLVPADLGLRGEDEEATSLSMLWRKRKAVLGLVGSCCKACGTPQFPPQRVCVNPECKAVDQMEDYRFSNRKGIIFTYTGDMLAFSYDPPQIFGLLDMDGGGRLFLDFTDCELEDLKVGDPVKVTFRRKYLDEKRGIHAYFWKATPVQPE